MLLPPHVYAGNTGGVSTVCGEVKPDIQFTTATVNTNRATAVTAAAADTACSDFKLVP
jgi:hypothetical protein